ncbi:MAG: hypothetical protein R3E01_20705 [Pirellulaceae bacterium]
MPNRSFGHSMALSVIVLMVSQIAGCGGKSEGVLVSGKVTFRNQPVTQGVINFFPDSGKTLGGAIQADGTFACHLLPGQYRVIVNAPPAAPPGWKDGDPMPTTTAQVPAHFARPDTSGLTLTVPDQAEPLTHDFPLN